jgi:hypothetical protein
MAHYPGCVRNSGFRASARAEQASGLMPCGTSEWRRGAVGGAVRTVEALYRGASSRISDLIPAARPRTRITSVLGADD